MIALSIKNTEGNPAGVIFNADHLTATEKQAMKLYMWVEVNMRKVILL